MQLICLQKYTISKYIDLNFKFYMKFALFVNFAKCQIGTGHVTIGSAYTMAKNWRKFVAYTSDDLVSIEDMYKMQLHA